MIKIKIKNRPYGFIYSESLPTDGFIEISIPVAKERVAVTGDYFDVADNHCAAVCAMNLTLILRRHRIGHINRCRIGNDRKKVFLSIHRFIGNGPVVFLKPKINRYFKSLGSMIRIVPISSYEEIEDSVLGRVPVALLVNAGITNWHWILVIGIRKYQNGSIYLNILDGWNKRVDRYLKYDGRDSFIRALRPVW